MTWWSRLQRWWTGETLPEHLRRGRLGEATARRHLEGRGLRFLLANYRTPRGEIDLVMQDGDWLVFVEVKTRSRGGWTRPSAAVDRGKRRRLSLAALTYLKSLPDPRKRVRFDVVEVLLEEGGVVEVRHLPDVFAFSAPYRYG
jgi:putative endonuclease